MAGYFFLLSKDLVEIYFTSALRSTFLAVCWLLDLYVPNAAKNPCALVQADLPRRRIATRRRHWCLAPVGAACKPAQTSAVTYGEHRLCERLAATGRTVPDQFNMN